MRTKSSPIQSFLSLALLLILAFSALHPPAAHAQGEATVKREINAQTGRLSFLLPENGLVVPAREALDQVPLGERRADPARALANRFGTEFGLQDPSRELSEIHRGQSDDGRVTVRYQQTYEGVPVLGGELIVHTNENGDLYSINGEVAADLALSTQNSVEPEEARHSALAAVAKWYQGDTEDFLVSEPELWIFDASLLMPSHRPRELVWRLEVTAVDHHIPVRELVLVNAQRGSISLHFNQIDTTWSVSAPAFVNPSSIPQGNPDTSEAAVLSADVATYTAGNTTSLPGTFLCAETSPNCTNGADLHADKAHAYAIGTYNLFATQHGRDSFDNAGARLVSTVHYDIGYENAFWSGTQMVYGDGYGFPLADDVVAHELAHGVTQHESNLFYFYQSGAINESFSDLWGEFYDQTNGRGDDSAAVAWKMGEEISGLGAIRDMRDPTLSDQPDKMSSPIYFQDSFDNGGVHINSGINNKAVYLLVDGGTFNGKAVTALGWVKTAAIYYEANTGLLTSGADYADLYFALQTACSSLIGQKDITPANCIEVKDAIEAVEMHTQPVPGFNTDAPYCDTGDPDFLFSDGMESGTGNWTFQNGPRLRWQVDSIDGPYAHQGNHSLFADDIPEEITDASARLKPLQVPANAWLHFAHSFQFESFLFFGEFDGGVLEYSLNGGSSWQDAGTLMDVNGYKGTIATGGGNPIEGRSAFVGSSHGYISTRLNLEPLAGRSVIFRWRMGLDLVGSGSFLESPSGWWLDEVKLYTCGALPGTFNKTSPANGGINVPLSTTLSWEGSPSAARYQYCYDIIDDNRCNRSWSGQLTTTSASIRNLGANTTYYWQVRAINDNGITEGDNQTWGSFRTTSTLPASTAGIVTYIGTTQRGSYSLPRAQGLRENYTGIDSGPVKMISTNSSSFLAGERVIYNVNGVDTSFSEMLGLPANQLDKVYWLPWYNNKTLDTQLRIANVSGSSASVHVRIGSAEVAGSPFTIPAGTSIRKSFPNIDRGPVRIESNVNILVTERVFYRVNGVDASFSEMVAMPERALGTIYWLPWYNNKTMDTQLRIANVSGASARVRVRIGGAEVAGSPFTIPAGTSIRKSFPDIDRGPVKIESNVDIVVSARVFHRVNGVDRSFSETMALPANQVDNIQWLPWYNSKTLNTQLRITNVSATSGMVHVYIGGVEVIGSPFSLGAGTTVRRSFPNIDRGPVKIESNVNIVASERVLYTVNGVETSYSELMALPDVLLDSIYWFPWYNNKTLETQLRFGVP